MFKRRTASQVSAIPESNFDVLALAMATEQNLRFASPRFPTPALSPRRGRIVSRRGCSSVAFGLAQRWNGTPSPQAGTMQFKVLST
jgi:hypothetical protein